MSPTGPVAAALCVSAMAVIAFGCGGPTTASRATPTAFDLQGHRGARGLAPENTLPGFERALAIGVTTLELDVQMTADGVLVVAHDPELSPNLVRDNGEYLAEPVAIRALKASELRRFDVGRLRPQTPYAARFPEQRGRDGISIPTLMEVIESAEIQAGGRIRFNIETKLDPRRPELTATPEAMAGRLAAVIKERGLLDRATVQSFDWRSLAWLRAHAPALGRVCLTSQQRGDDTVEAGKDGASPWLAGLDADDYPDVPALVQAAGCQVWSPDHRDLDRDLVRKAHARGLRVVPWTVNEGADLERVLELGVDGLISDYPDRARKKISESGRSLPDRFSP